MSASQWFEVLCSYAVQVVVVTAAAYLLDRISSGSRTRSSIWSTFYWSVLLLACAAILLPRLRLFQPWDRLQPNTVLSIAESQILLGKILLPIWMLGVGVSLFRWLRCGVALQKMLCRCERLSKQETTRLLLLAGEEADCSLSPVIVISDEVDGPFCWQFHEPTIVLPRFMLESSDADLAHVMLHELAHLRTHHPLQLFLQHAVQVICWFHPVVWRATRRVSLVREFVCDDAAMDSGVNTAAYLRTLLHIAERSEAKNVTLGFGKNRSEVIVRTRRLVGFTKQEVAEPRAGLSRTIAIAAMIMVSAIVSQCWLPIDALASSRTTWSPWPTWSATALHSFGVAARDYEPFDHRTQIHELREDQSESKLLVRSE